MTTHLDAMQEYVDDDPDGLVEFPARWVAELLDVVAAAEWVTSFERPEQDFASGLRELAHRLKRLRREGES